MPLDYAIVTTGLAYRFSETEMSRGQNRESELARTTFITEALHSLSIPENDRQKLLTMLSFQQNDAIYKDINSMNLQILEGFSFLFNHPHERHASDRFLEILQGVGLSSFSYQKENTLLFEIGYLFHQFKQFSDEKIAILPFNTGKMGGSLLIVIEKGYSRTTFQKVLDHLRQDHAGICLYHASWRDRTASSGVRLEQYLSNEVYSDYTQKGDILYRDSFGASYAAPYEGIIQREVNGILLDTIAGRIYIR